MVILVSERDPVRVGTINGRYMVMGVVEEDGWVRREGIRVEGDLLSDN